MTTIRATITTFLQILVEMMNKPGPGKISEELPEVIEAGIRILAYSQNTEKQLRVKLKRKGYNPDLIDSAIEYFIEKGYLNDIDYINHVVENLAKRKLYGAVRIKTELYRMGFSYELIQNLSFGDIDFEENCVKMLKKRGGEFNDKNITALRRYGYSGSEIKAAYKLIKNEDDN